MSSRLLFAALLMSGLATACSGSAQSGAAPAAPPPTPVEAVTLEPKPLPQTSEFVASIRSLRSMTIQPQVDGILRQILVKSGDHVRVGQPLVQIDPDQQQAAVSATESQRAAREADLALANQQLARVKQLQAAGAVSQADLDQAEAAAKTAAAQLDAVRSQIREQQVQLHYYRVTAPAAGIIGDIPVRVGDRVTSATAITTIDANEGYEVYVNVPLERSADVRVGLPVQLLDQDGMVIASNPITFVAPRADDGTQSILVKAALRTVPPSTRAMQYARARIVWSNTPGLTVPVVAVNRIGGQYFVFLAEAAPKGGSIARQKPVSLGSILGNDYVVTGGLKPGDRVIVSNLQKIGDGAPVKPEA